MSSDTVPLIKNNKKPLLLLLLLNTYHHIVDFIFYTHYAIGRWLYNNDDTLEDM